MHVCPVYLTERVVACFKALLGSVILIVCNSEPVEMPESAGTTFCEYWNNQNAEGTIKTV